ncbi:MAG: flavin reductase family protein [Pseudomonas sp.]|jgi:flavin reductase (DIM6/NTAB) family NADH-FMN oxidoreductase RutF|uniref:flavin reductase family protein n=1 Tax=Denitrificimonas caeni TaxID=521720 RepID=UPI001962810B|nr:flavin reductase family protein [Denitrificimonas caeni]MDD2223303.1 flavin reductase family protein [Pseudomonas sp.]MDY0208127.1 flavin reductase family protein [Pseudomonas sp.]
MIDQKSLRAALGHFATGVTIVTTRDCAGQPVGMTASSFNTVSLDPPLILWSIGRNAYSYSAFSKAEHFAVHVLGDEHQEWSNRFGRSSEEKFSGLDVCEGLGAVPLLSNCPARFECSVEHRYDGGDHTIIVGRVLRMEHVKDNEVKPLLFHCGRYAVLANAE